MNRGSVARAYQSPLRDEQSQKTRERILDGLLVAMKGGLAQLSIPAVARAARVSVPTVYRHFPNKQALFSAITAHVGKKMGVATETPPADPDALLAWIREIYRQHDAVDPTTAAAMSGALGGEIRRANMMPRRLRMIDEALASVMATLPAAEQKHLRDVVVVLASSSALRTFRDYLGCSPDEAADTVEWALRRLIGRGKRWKPSSKRR